MECMQAIALLPAVSMCMLLKQVQDEHRVHFEIPVAITFVCTHTHEQHELSVDLSPSLTAQQQPNVCPRVVP